MANEPYVVFSQRAFNSIVTETIHKNPVETGGILIGYVLDNGVRIVVENIPPGQNSQHKWGYCYEEVLKGAFRQCIYCSILLLNPNEYYKFRNSCSH